MDYIKIRFGNDFDQLASKLDKTFEEMFRSRLMSPMFTSSERTWSPQMDIYETQDEIIIQAEIAGVDKENLEVEISSKAVRIYGKRSEIPLIKNATYRLAEIQYGKFERILFVTSSYSNGFLKIQLAKLPVDVTHKIPISDG
jgi:HSP20 family protein